MFREEKNLKDPERKPTASYGSGHQNMSVTGSVISYTKTNKLITALYMVTDIIDKDEPLRNKLRALGTEILSDMNLIQENNIGHISSNANRKISETMSFLDIASAVNIISEMNCSILKKEFAQLSESIFPTQTSEDLIDKVKTVDRPINLSEFFSEPNREELDTYRTFSLVKGTVKERVSIGHPTPTRIGVQKGSTLMKALSDKAHLMSNRNKKDPASNEAEGFYSGFDVFKKQRRNDIVNIIKTLGGNATIKDIKDKANASQGKIASLSSCSEKTLQRELVSMVKDGVLNKVGEKRWSRYFLK